MKYRLIQRNDGKFQYEWAPSISPKDEPIMWHRIEYMVFYHEEAAREKFQEVISFTHKAAVAKVIDEIEI